MSNENQGRTASGEIEWKRTDYRRLAFPDSCNYFGAITSIFKATKTASSAAGLRYWWDGLVAERGIAGAEAEKERVFSRGHRIDDTADMLIRDYEGYKKVVGSVISTGHPQIYSNHYLSAFADDYDWRVLAFLATNNTRLICNEIPVWSRTRKTKGYLDMLMIIDGVLFVTDFKGTTKEKKPDSAMFDEPAQQVSNYRSSLVEMYNDAMDGNDDDAAELFAQIPGLTPELVNNSQCLLLYFQDGKDEAVPFVLMTDEQRKAKVCEAEAEKFKNDNCVGMTYEMIRDQLHDETEVRKLPSWKDGNKFLSIDWRMEQLERRMKKYNSYPVVFLDQNEQSFWRRRWKRVQPGNVVEASDFDTMLNEETERLTNPAFGIDEAKINF